MSLPSSQTELEAALIAQAQAGSRQAFERLVRLYVDNLYRWLVLQARDRTDAEDALQEALLAAWKYIGSYRGEWRFSTWLYRIAARKLSRRRDTVAPLEVDELDAGLAHPATQIDRQNIWLRVARAVPGEQVRILWLYYVEEMEIAEIASVVRRSVSWVKVNLHRARTTLRPVLEEYHEHA